MVFERAKSLSHVNGRPAASLSSGLLARKGQAAPAMRPQLGGGFVSSFGADLGWNDMGHDTPAPVASPAIALREELRERIAEVPAPAPVVEMPVPEPTSAALPSEPVATPAPAIEAEVSDVPVRGPAPRLLRQAPASAPTPGEPAPAKLRRAAFTLRLDAERHRKLRVAALLGHRSCQHLVTEALDQFLATNPDVAEWADRLSRDQATS